MSQTIPRETYDNILKSACENLKVFEEKRERFVFNKFIRDLIETKATTDNYKIVNIHTQIIKIAARLDPKSATTVDRADDGRMFCQDVLVKSVFLAKLAKRYQTVVSEIEWSMTKAFSIGLIIRSETNAAMAMVYQLKSETHSAMKRLVERMSGLKTMLEMRATSSKIEAELPKTVVDAKRFPNIFIAFVERFLHIYDPNDDVVGSSDNNDDVVGNSDNNDDVVGGSDNIDNSNRVQYFWLTNTRTLKLMLERAAIVCDTIFDAIGRPTPNAAWQHPIYLRETTQYDDSTMLCKREASTSTCKLLLYHSKWEFCPDVPPTQSSFWELD